MSKLIELFANLPIWLLVPICLGLIYFCTKLGQAVLEDYEEWQRLCGR